MIHEQYNEFRWQHAKLTEFEEIFLLVIEAYWAPLVYSQILQHWYEVKHLMWLT